jgi:hypothetical protein
MHCRKAFREKRDRQREEGSRPYVVLRIAHSLVQALINNVMIGFLLLAGHLARVASSHDDPCGLDRVPIAMDRKELPPEAFGISTLRTGCGW